MKFVKKAVRFGKILGATRRTALEIMRSDRAGGTQAYAHEQMQNWARELLKILRVEVTVVGKPHSTPALFVGNHMSYLDIPLLVSSSPVVFVAKKQLADWPVFGHGMKSVGTVFVDRDSAHSRKSAAEAIAPSILKSRQSVVVFASGTTTLTEEKPWRWGAFLIGKRYGIPVQPFRLSYQPARAVAYIKEDFFPLHLWRLLGQERIEAKLEFHDPITVGDPQEEAMKWWQWARQGLPISEQESRVDV